MHEQRWRSRGKRQTLRPRSSFLDCIESARFLKSVVENQRQFQAMVECLEGDMEVRERLLGTFNILTWVHLTSGAVGAGVNLNHSGANLNHWSNDRGAAT